eukprot:6196608-Pleurochrysis_carterae.AAC.7
MRPARAALAPEACRSSASGAIGSAKARDTHGRAVTGSPHRGGEAAARRRSSQARRSRKAAQAEREPATIEPRRRRSPSTEAGRLAQGAEGQPKDSGGTLPRLQAAGQR